ncbi:MAG: GAF domain-containing sensor histidine kinase [Firmicutes bacterium]|nr:GAF domain-containing sensor histidine kinase [Melghirimyces thermohalophilus]MDA8354476.1 GAF domain-containing sensor histidine kinase [Bacillota bacterium]
MAVWMKMKWQNWLERTSRWSVVFFAWFLSLFTLLKDPGTGWSLLHLITLSALLMFTEFFPFPGHEGRVTVHFPFLFTLSSMFSPGLAGVVYTVIVLTVTWSKKHSLYRAAFRTGYTIIGLYGVQLFLATIGITWINQGGIGLPFLALTGCVLVYELVSKGIRDGVEYLRARPRWSRLWLANWKLETGGAVLSLIYCLAYYGMLHVGRETDPLAFLFFYAPLAAFAVLSHVIVKLARKEHKLKILLLLASDINKNLDLRKVMEKTLLPLSKVIPYSFGFFHLMKNGRLHPAVIAGDVPVELKERSLPLNHGISGWVAAHGVPAMVHNTKDDPRCHGDLEAAEELRSLLSVPLIMEGEVLGVITLGKTEERAFDDADLTFLQVLASQSVVAIKNARLLEERERRVVAEERNRLAREIHDGIAQSFAGVLMKVDSSLKIFDSQPEKVREWLEESRLKLRDGLKEVRHSITALRPSPAAKIGLIPALRRRVEAFENETGADGIFEQKGERFPLTSEVEETIYMVCHEALSNAAKHAKAENVRVQLAFSSDHVCLTVEDDGVGFSLAKAVHKAEAQKRYGIVGMSERAQKLGSALQFDSEEGKGTRVILTIPIGEEEEAAVHAH